MRTWAPEQKRIVETELFRIADSLLHYIRPPALHAHLEKGGSLDLFNGSAGLIIFYLRLYDHCRLPIYLDACKAAADSLLTHPAVLRQPYYTLYTGATGLLYLCIKMYEATGATGYLQRALELAGHFEQGIFEQVTQDDLISGNAGNILVLTYLHAHTKDHSLIPLIRRLSDKMILHARIAPQGLRWGHVKKSYDCLTGFSHGAAGIAYALMQAAQYFGDEGLQYLAGQALDYEMRYYDRAANNWLDLRLTSTRLYEADIMDWEISDFRKYASDANSWAHGAAGVGLARLYAWQVTGHERYARHAQLVVQRSLQDLQSLKRGDFTLCSGYGGIAAFLLQAAAILRQPALQSSVQALALAAVSYYRQHGTYNAYINDSINDPGLFSGLAGVGYFLLNALSASPENAVTNPIIHSPPDHLKTPLYLPGEVKHLLFSRYYKRTVTLLQQQEALTIEQIASVGDIHAMEHLLQQKISGLAADVGAKITDAFSFERSTTRLWQQHRGLLHYTRRKELLQASAAALLSGPPESLLQTVLLPVSNLSLCHTSWPWHEYPAEALSGGDRYHYLSYSHEHGVSTFPVGRLTATILAAFRPQRTLQLVITDILGRHFPDADEATGRQITLAIISQVRSLLQQCFISPT